MTNRALSENLPALLTVEQAAEQLGISRARCYQLITSENDNPPKIASVRVGRLRRIAAVDLEDFVAGLRTSQAPTGR